MARPCSARLPFEPLLRFAAGNRPRRDPHALDVSYTLTDPGGSTGSHSKHNHTMSRRFAATSMWSGAPFTARGFAIESDTHPRQVERWKAQGLTVKAAENVCDRLGVHPMWVWGDEYYEAAGCPVAGWEDHDELAAAV